MSGLNLSDWALKHRSLVVYMMIIAVVAGALSYFRLGRNEDPAFIIKTMVVQAAWPGASVDETMAPSRNDASHGSPSACATTASRTSPIPSTASR